MAERTLSEDLGVGGASLRHFKLVRDPRGTLAVADFGADVPFVPARYFVVFDVPGERGRGGHAHVSCHQVLACVRGSVRIELDDGARRAEVLLDGPGTGLHVPPMVWCAQHFLVPDAVLLVFASEPYDPEDYVRDRARFLALRAASGA